MASKLVVFSCLLAFAHGSVAPAALAAAPVYAARLEELDPFPQYRYGYAVADALTGDVKSANEERNGDVVSGQYSLIDSDGTRRVVDYSADSVNGFNAVVRKEPLVAAPPAVVAEPAVLPARIAAAPVAAPVAAVAPARYTAVAPAPVYANYAAAPAPVYANYAAAPVAAARYAYAPATAVAPARYAVAEAAAPLVAARYAAAPSFTYASPYTAAYASPYAAYTAPFSSAAVSQYAASGPLAAYSQYPAPLAAYTSYPTAYGAAPVGGPVQVAAYRAPVAAAPAKLIDATPVATGYLKP